MQLALKAAKTGALLRNYYIGAALFTSKGELVATAFGAESITNLGGYWNTTGSTMVGLLAKHCKVPLYIPTELMKFDNCSPPGTMRTPIWKDIPAILKNDPILLDKKYQSKPTTLTMLILNLLLRLLQRREYLLQTEQYKLRNVYFVRSIVCAVQNLC